MSKIDPGQKDDDFIPDSLLEAAREAVANSLPEKSKLMYAKSYQNFLDWKKKNNTKSCAEEVFIAYAKEMAEKFNSATIISRFSMIKKEMINKENVDIGRYKRLQHYLNKLHVDYKPKQAEILTTTQVYEFLDRAPDIKYLPHKVALVIGLSGACKRCELHKITTKMVKMREDMCLIHIPTTKTHVPKTFTIEGQYLHYVKDYLNLRPKELQTDKFFISYRKGKCIDQPIGINKIGKFCVEVAQFLNLPNPTSYTGHTFRRTSTTILADTGANAYELKRHGQWKRLKAAEKYVSQSETHLKKTSKTILNSISKEENDTEDGPTPAKQSKLDTPVAIEEILDNLEIVSSGPEPQINQSIDNVKKRFN